MKFLDEVYRLEIQNEEDMAFNKVTRNIEKMLSKGRFADVDRILKEVDLDKIEPWVQSAFLSATKYHKDKLRHRDSLKERIYDEIARLQGPYVADRLAGD